MFRMHPGDHRLLLAHAGELAPAVRASIARHVHGCAACQDRQARLTATLDRFADDEADDVDTRAESLAVARRRLQRAMWHESRGDAPSINNTLPRWMPATMMAAAVLLAVFVIRTVASGDAPAVQMAGAHALPVATVTPGAVSSLSADALCAGERPSRVVTADVRARVLDVYGMRDASADSYELDALITPELGGTADLSNVWPQRYSATWNAHVKDALETLLAGRVCRHEMPLATAQQALATDWIASYQRYFSTGVPLAVHAQATAPDDDLLVQTTSPAVLEAHLKDAPTARPVLMGSRLATSGIARWRVGPAAYGI